MEHKAKCVKCGFSTNGIIVKNYETLKEHPLCEQCNKTYSKFVESRIMYISTKKHTVLPSLIDEFLAGINVQAPIN